ncbi:MAG: hypothetical protein ACPG77_11435 [Nannocystaceae bacterium]
MSTLRYAQCQRRRGMDAKLKRSVLWFSLFKFGGKEAERDNLLPNATHVVELSVTGKIDGVETSEVVDGTLSIGGDNPTTATSGPKPEEVLAYVLGKLNGPIRDAVLENTPIEFRQAGNKLNTHPDHVLKCKTLMERLRSSHPATRRGNVVFSPKTG